MCDETSLGLVSWSFSSSLVAASECWEMLHISTLWYERNMGDMYSGTQSGTQRCVQRSVPNMVSASTHSLSGVLYFPLTVTLVLLNKIFITLYLSVHQQLHQPSEGLYFFSV